MQKTIEQYHRALDKCQSVFLKKTKDYGTAWRILRPSSLTDQLFIKASRIRSIEEKNGLQKVGESVEGEYIALVNYSLLALIQLSLTEDSPMEITYENAARLYELESTATKELMLAKNHDYGEAWREMRLASLTDMILQKLLRTKQIENNDGETLISEGVDGNYRDIINYALFALIKIEESGNQAG